MSNIGSDRTAELLGDLERHGSGGLNPTAGQLEELVAADRAGPLQFVNLLEFHAAARYPTGHELVDSGLSGAEAYALYGAVAIEHVARRGGRLLLYNEVVQVLVGSGQPWHQLAVVEYPDTGAFLDMISDPDYVAALVHRDAGLARTVLLVSRALGNPLA